ncbi:hypothetical protein [uncultured Roseobacter sp.]|uniref:hypothetical protein n=1 Tax=uncultured Roseobacter sp. TaxID=114847 RepID=UPI0026113631|nr:hypothetical protein [uncultured Roseobacter sp.]
MRQHIWNVILTMLLLAPTMSLAGGGPGHGVVSYRDTPRLPVVTPVTEEEIRAEARRLLQRVFVQANTDYQLRDWLVLLTDVSELVGSFDSKFHDLENNQKLFSFRGRTLTGSDLNYYFMGVFFSAYGWPEASLKLSMRAWKKAKYGGSPSADALWAAEQGHADGVHYQFQG